MSTFVSVGNATQPFRRLVEGVARIAPSLPQPVLIQHGHTPLDSGACERVAFLSMEEFSDHINSAELLILHAGAGSVLHALQAGKKPVVVPRRSEFGEHVNNHQLEFSDMLADAGKIYLVEDIADLDKVIRDAVSLTRAGRVAGGEAQRPTPEPRMVALIRDILSQRGR